MIEAGASVEVLDDKLTQLEIVLCTLKRTLDINRIVSLNTQKIKEVGGVGQFFAHVYQATLECLVLGICRVFEKPGRRTRDLHSLPGALFAAKMLPVHNPNALRDFLRRQTRDDEHQLGDVIRPTICDVEKAYARFWTAHNSDFQRMRTVRNKMIAHAEYIEEDVRPKSLPSYDFMERLLLFAVDLNATLLRAYLDVSAHRIKDDGITASSTHNLLTKLGIENVKMRFDDDE